MPDGTWNPSVKADIEARLKTLSSASGEQVRGRSPKANNGQRWRYAVWGRFGEDKGAAMAEEPLPESMRPGHHFDRGAITLDLYRLLCMVLADQQVARLSIKSRSISFLQDE
jgi:hypothetical protein